VSRFGPCDWVISTLSNGTGRQYHKKAYDASLKAKYPFCIRDDLSTDCLFIEPFDARYRFIYFAYMDRFVALSTEWRWRDKWAIGLGHEHIEWRVPNNLVVVMRESEHSRKRECESLV
jgi:hypothetical protein